MEKMPLVSIITPIYNSEAFIADCINSVKAQTYNNWEMILVDDNSTDNSFSIIKKFASEDKRIKIIRLEENKGAGIARNASIEAAKGNFVAFLDADDLWKPQKLEKQINFMQNNSAAVCFCSYELMDEEGNPTNQKIEALEFLDFKKLEKSNYVGNLTGIYDVGKLGKIYAPILRKRQDWALWLKAVKKAGTAYGIKEPLAYYRVRKGSISGNKFSMLRYNYAVYKDELGYGSMKSLWKMGIFLKEHFFVKPKQLKRLK